MSFSCLSIASQRELTYPVTEDSRDLRSQFIDELLQQVFANQTNYQLKALKLGREYAAQPILLKRGDIDIGWFGVQKKNAEALDRIPFPLYRGLLGYRVMLLRAQDKGLLRHVSSVEQLKEFTLGQGESWSDTKIFRHNQFNLVTATGYDELFEMLKTGRFDAFPRSILEVSAELKEFSEDKLVLDKYLLLHYPQAMFIHVLEQHSKLSDFIDTRLKLLVANGTYQTLFDKHYRSSLDVLLLARRKLISLPNPGFPTPNPKHRHLYIDPLQRYPGIKNTQTK